MAAAAYSPTLWIDRDRQTIVDGLCARILKRTGLTENLERNPKHERAALDAAVGVLEDKLKNPIGRAMFDQLLPKIHVTPLLKEDYDIGGNYHIPCGYYFFPIGWDNPTLVFMAALFCPNMKQYHFELGGEIDIAVLQLSVHASRIFARIGNNCFEDVNVSLLKWVVWVAYPQLTGELIEAGLDPFPFLAEAVHLYTQGLFTNKGHNLYVCGPLSYKFAQAVASRISIPWWQGGAAASVPGSQLRQHALELKCSQLKRDKEQLADERERMRALMEEVLHDRQQAAVELELANTRLRTELQAMRDEVRKLSQCVNCEIARIEAQTLKASVRTRDLRLAFLESFANTYNDSNIKFEIISLDVVGVSPLLPENRMLRAAFEQAIAGIEAQGASPQELKRRIVFHSCSGMDIARAICATGLRKAECYPCANNLQNPQHDAGFFGKHTEVRTVEPEPRSILFDANNLNI
eukprot:m.260862 g.260862  ORF g.260862 m.260862 type:complete len:464 (+) comp24074_c0_seq1:134-1525(+)